MSGVEGKKRRKGKNSKSAGAPRNGRMYARNERGRKDRERRGRSVGEEGG